MYLSLSAIVLSPLVGYGGAEILSYSSTICEGVAIFCPMTGVALVVIWTEMDGAERKEI